MQSKLNVGLEGSMKILEVQRGLDSAVVEMGLELCRSLE